MIIKEVLREVIKSQRENLNLEEFSIEREAKNQIDIKIPFVFVISGIRRCGKSTLLKQIMNKIKSFNYFNFEDTRIVNFEVGDFQKLEEIFKEEYGERNFYFFDEIQNVPKWETFVRKLLDNKKHIVITGSNASLLSKELGTKLTGRHLNFELFPFSYKEFLSLVNKKSEISSFQEYFEQGGFPEYLKIEKEEILQELFRDILNRDIAIRYKLRNINILKEITLYLLTNIGKEFSYNSLKKIFDLGSTNSVISLISHLEDSYLLFTIPKFDYSLKKQLVSPKKIYAIDTGLIRINSSSFSEDKGKMLENMVFINLRKKYKNIFYFQEKKECDFVIKEKTKITKAVQVCYELNDDNKEREIKGLVEALKKFNLKKGLILTFDQQDEFIFDNKIVKVLPVWKWLLDK